MPFDPTNIAVLEKLSLCFLRNSVRFQVYYFLRFTNALMFH